MEDYFFYLFTAIALVLALMTITTQYIFRAALYLTGVLNCIAAIYILLGAEFLAAVQVMVYVGGIMVLIIFAVLLTSRLGVFETQVSRPRKLIGALISLTVFLTMTAGALFDTFVTRTGPYIGGQGNTERIAMALLGTGREGYVLPFEVISLVLLGAIIGAIVVARKKDEPLEETDGKEGGRS